MKARQHKSIAIGHAIKQRIRKSTHRCAAGIAHDNGELQRRLCNAQNLAVNFGYKRCAKAFAAGCVPVSRLNEIKPRGG